MKKIFIFILQFSLIYSRNYADLSNFYVITEPVIDLILDPLARVVKSVDDIKQCYASFSCSWGTKGSCLRAHQGIFNEIIMGCQVYGDEIECKLYNCFYEDSARQKLSNFWSLACNCSCLKNYENNIEFLDSIPPVFDPFSADEYDVATLVMPFFDADSKKIYSAGTRFMIDEITDNYIVCKVPDYQKIVVNTISIPRDVCITELDRQVMSKREIFVETLKKWTSISNEKIPYIWGGCSFINAIKPADFKLTQLSTTGWQVYERPKKFKLHCGFDCTGLTLRAAQIAGLPFYYKNSITMKNNLAVLDKNQIIEDGDLIWFKGHVLIISDIKNNKVIEARGYAAGYGIVHEANIWQIFENVKDLRDLLKAYYEDKELMLKDINGKVTGSTGNFSILKLVSA